ncbi:hypothetical protein FA13DRAFT_1272225 [Coprinellus micaceus]|uniref:Uncharacterized protein n=1 Tax=Coprinellus micaceus TaxID=71717 RepID=A0A4Y7ST20_COPMI|nr:hypothetical protein FA13DRAFT_1272225 [Coprinellus micaceus]
MCISNDPIRNGLLPPPAKAPLSCTHEVRLIAQLGVYCSLRNRLFRTFAQGSDEEGSMTHCHSDYHFYTSLDLPGAPSNRRPTAPTDYRRRSRGPRAGHEQDLARLLPMENQHSGEKRPEPAGLQWLAKMPRRREEGRTGRCQGG